LQQRQIYATGKRTQAQGTKDDLAGGGGDKNKTVNAMKKKEAQRVRVARKG